MRLFFGLSLPENIRLAAAQRALVCRDLIPGRYGIEENYHITLAFLGDVPPERVDDARAVLANALAAHPAPVLTLGETSYFGRRQNAILTLAVHSAPPLDTLHERLVRALAAASLPADTGPFSPHITLARHAAVPEGALPSGPALSFSPREAHVFLSARDAQGILRYTPIASVPFFRK